MEKPFVTCKIYGQLGNQLFQTAATLAYAWDYGALPIFPALHNPAWRISYNKDRFFSRLDASPLSRPWLHEFKEKNWYSPERIPFQRDLLIDGYLQSWKHFDHHRERILQTFAPSSLTMQYLQAKYGSLLSNPKIVGVHVRTQSKRTHNAGVHPFWGLSYYEKTASLFPSDSLFVIFSDRINWCKRHFPKHFIFVEGNSGIEDFVFLSLCKNQILCNSSFSWWAAYFNQHPEAKIVFPTHWKDPFLHANPPVDSFFLPHWTLIDDLEKKPYPEDMFSYDSLSQSVDNND
ncbi:MAG: alpha-1,2-fucosyltransferase [Chlamydiales bacterium]|nr:alpha-1,2-fucosyltransferase [Chlamydiales bacterium]